MSGSNNVQLTELISNSQIAFLSGKLQEAFSLAKEAIKLDPECADAYQCAANVCMSLNRYDDAIEYYHTYFVGKSNVRVHNAEYGNCHYNNPSDNPKVLADAVQDPNAVYGYRPSEDGSLKNFANKDWSDPTVVESAKQERIAYIADDQEINRLVSDMRNQGYSSEDIARAACDFRNQTRLNSYIDANGNITDYDGYAAALERMTTRSYDALIQSGKTPEQIISSSTRTNPAMDAIVGLYDQNFDTY